MHERLRAPAPDAATELEQEETTEAPRRSPDDPAADIGALIVQAKLSVGPVDDPLEREADDVARRVVKSIAQHDHDPTPTPEEAAPEPRAQRRAAPDLSDGDTGDGGPGDGVDRDHGGDDPAGNDAGDIVIGRRIQRAPAATPVATHTITPATPRIQRLRNPFKKKQAPAAPVISGPGNIDADGQFHERFDARQQEGISAPTNVHVRSGTGGIEPLGAIDTSMRELDESSALGAAELSQFARGTVEGEAGAPGAHQEFPDADELGENDKLFPAPSSDDISAPSTDELDDDPVSVIKAYAHWSGELLKFTQRHDVKIERYARYFEADYEAVAMAKVEFEGAEAADDQDKQDDLEKQVGGNPIGEFHYAQWRLDRAHIAEQAADKEVPLVDGAYENARDTQKQHAKAGSGKSIAVTKQRIAEYTKQVDERAASGKSTTKAQKKLDGASAQLVALEAAKGDVGRLVGLVKQAKMSEDLLRVKRVGLKRDKQEVKKGKKRGVSLGKHLRKKGGVALASAMLSAGTLGVVALNQEKVDGGYSSKKRVTWLWPRIKDEFTRIRETWDKRPYGKATAFHLGLEGLSFVVKEIRNVFMSAALIALGISLIPGAAVVAGPIAGFCSTMAVALAAVKLVIDAILAGWSLIARATNTNARNSDLLMAQAARQGGDVIGDAAAVGMAFGGAALGNEVAGEKLYDDPYQRTGNDAWSGTTRSVDYTDGRDLGAAATNVGSRTGAKLVADGAKEAMFVEPIAETSLQNTKLRHLREGRRDAQGAEIERADVGPVEEHPAWVTAALGEEAEARRASLTTLVTVHMSKIKRFNTKTQKLMSDNQDIERTAPKMAQRAEEPEQQQDGNALAQVAGGLRQTMASGVALTSELDVDVVLADVGMAPV